MKITNEVWDKIEKDYAGKRKKKFVEILVDENIEMILKLIKVKQYRYRDIAHMLFEIMKKEKKNVKRAEIEKEIRKKIRQIKAKERPHKATADEKDEKKEPLMSKQNKKFASLED